MRSKFYYSQTVQHLYNYAVYVRIDYLKATCFKKNADNVLQITHQIATAVPIEFNNNRIIDFSPNT